MTACTPAQLFVVDGHHSLEWKRQVAPSFIVSLLLHALLLVYFGHHILTANLSTVADSHAQLSVILRPPSPSAILPLTESPSLAPSRSSRHNPGEITGPKSDATDLPQSTDDNRSDNLAANPRADTDFSLAAEDNRSLPIDMEAAYGTARQYGKSSRGQRSQTAISDLPALERETPLGRSVAKSARQDCRTARAGLGLIAIPFLIADTVSDRGCKW